jgi:LAS superfamily LD-carboxypeptidase LdcB
MFLSAALMGLLSTISTSYSYEDEMCYEDMCIDYRMEYDVPTEGYDHGEKIVLLCSTIPFQKSKYEWFKLETEAAHSFMDLAEAANHRGFDIDVNSAYRTKHEQKKLRRRLGDIAAPVGWSNHQSGTAVDIDGTMAFVPEHRIKKKWFSKKRCKASFKHGTFGYYCPTRLFWWLKRNAPKYGFYNTVDNEPWHWDYLGVKASRRLVRR